MLTRLSQARRRKRLLRSARADDAGYDAVLVDEGEVEDAVARLGEAHPHYHGKTWDLWRAIALILGRHPPLDTRILDAGCSYSPLLDVLGGLGYSRLVGCDLVTEGFPDPTMAACARADLTRLPLDDSSCSVITSISVLEHGVDLDVAFREFARVLCPGGDVLISTDYRDPKLTTADVDRAITFGAPWTIFDRSEIDHLISVAAAHGFAPLDAMSWGPSENPVSWAGKTYTFVFLALTTATA